MYNLHLTSPLSSNLSDEEYLGQQQQMLPSVEGMLPIIEIMINFRFNGIKTKKNCFVYAEKLDAKGIIQLRVSEKNDQRKMYLTTIDSASFQELKQEQSLHVTFAGFIENLVHILQDCQQGKLEICLVQSNLTNNHHNTLRTNEASNCPLSPGSSGISALQEYQLQFVEIRPFKNLVHLSLPCRLAPLNVVLFYLNNILDNIQKKYLAQEQLTQQAQHESHNHLKRIEQLDEECSKLRESLLETTRNLNKKHSEEVLHLQESIREMAEQRQLDNERHRKGVQALQGQIDKLITEKANLQADKVHDQKRNDSLNEELIAIKGRLNNLKEVNEHLHSEVSTLKNQERINEMHLQDSRKETNELKEQLRKADKSMSGIVAELEAEKKISQTKRQALEMATEEISKANEIIVKQSQELSKLKKTIAWRTEVALQQERAIKESELILQEKIDQITFLTATVNTLRNEIPKELEQMRNFAQTLEDKYTDQIIALKAKLELLDKENQPPPTNSRHLSGKSHRH